MSVATVTPRVRTIVICDDVFASVTEDGVFNLEGVRQHLYAESFPMQADLNLFLLVSCVRKGRYPGRVLVTNRRNDKAIRYQPFAIEIQEENALIAFALQISNCLFPEAGQYAFEVHFSVAGGAEALKGELPFVVLTQEG